MTEKDVASRPWTEQEKDMLAAHKGSDRELAAKINRTVRAIRSMRSEMKREGEL